MSFHDNSAVENMPSDHHYSDLHKGGSPGEKGDFFDDHPMLEALFCYGWMFLLFYCLLCRGRREIPSTEVGDRIRARAREAQERIQQKKIKEDQSPEERRRVVDENMVTKVVLSKDEEGNLTLGQVGADPEADELQTNHLEASEEEDVESQQHQAHDNNDKNLTHLAADDDEEGPTCVICLDSFEPGDLVSWTKHDPTCTHVFHDECIRQWLEERRQDECPSCRCHLVPPVKVPKSLDDDSDEEERNEDRQEQDPEQGIQETDDSDTNSTASSSSEPKEDDESGFFSIISGLLNRSTISRRNGLPSPPASGDYNLVSVNSNSFDSQDVPEQVQDEPDDQVQHESTSLSDVPSDSSDGEEAESSQQQWLASNESETAVASVETMTISEALRQSEAVEDDEEMGTAKNRATVELHMQDIVADVVFSP